ncbi:MAG: M23 family metallopeptidase [Clostridia bacterium]|nr:M23 family metallopeptidase [Clostridia bacterium]
MPKYHTGIDIAANTGTQFISAMSGTVVQVSSEGDYGNHVKIEQDDVITLYAHCNAIYVKEGEFVTQGQIIGEVGETGNATGPHLHFEIRKSDRYVDPDDVLDF